MQKTQKAEWPEAEISNYGQIWLLPVHVNKVLLGHSCAHSFLHGLWLL